MMSLGGTIHVFQDAETLETVRLIGGGATTADIPTVGYTEVLQALHPIYTRNMMTRPYNVYVNEYTAPYTINQSSPAFSTAMYATNVQTYASMWTVANDPVSLLTTSACQAYAAQWSTGATATTLLSNAYTGIIKALNNNNTVGIRNDFNRSSLALQSHLLLTWYTGFLGYRFSGITNNLLVTTEAYGTTNTATTSLYMPAPVASIYAGDNKTPRGNYIAATVV